MNPWLIAAGVVVAGAVLTKSGPQAQGQSGGAVAPTKGGAILLRNARAAAALRGQPLAVDGAFGSRVSEAGASGASGYRGGTSPPRIRCFAGLGLRLQRARSEGLPLGMAQAQLPWWPGKFNGQNYFQGPDGPVQLPSIATVGGTRDAIRHSTDQGFNDADRWWGPGLLFDGDDVAWIFEFGDSYGWNPGESMVSVGMGAAAAMALDAEHQVTGATAEWSRAAWELDAPRVVNRGGAWVLEGFGASELAEGQRLNMQLGRAWAERVNGYPLGTQGNHATQGTTARNVWQPLIQRARDTIGRDAGPGYVAGSRVFDLLIWNR